MRRYSWTQKLCIKEISLVGPLCGLAVRTGRLLQRPFVKKSGLKWKDYRWFWDTIGHRLKDYSVPGFRGYEDEPERVCVCTYRRLRDRVAVRRYMRIICCAGQSHRRGTHGAFTDLRSAAQPWSAFFFPTWSRCSRFCRGALPFPASPNEPAPEENRRRSSSRLIRATMNAWKALLSVRSGERHAGTFSRVTRVSCRRTEPDSTVCRPAILPNSETVKITFHRRQYPFYWLSVNSWIAFDGIWEEIVNKIFFEFSNRL